MHSATTAETWTSVEMPTSPTMRPQTGRRGRRVSLSLIFVPFPLPSHIPFSSHVPPSIFVSCPILISCPTLNICLMSHSHLMSHPQYLSHVPFSSRLALNICLIPILPFHVSPSKFVSCPILISCPTLNICLIPILPFHVSPSKFVSFPFSHSTSHPQYLCPIPTILISSLVPRPLWCCSHCNNPYNRDHIEQSLIDAVQRRSMSVVLQDLVCTKCQGVRPT